MVANNHRSAGADMEFFHHILHCANEFVHLIAISNKQRKSLCCIFHYLVENKNQIATGKKITYFKIYLQHGQTAKDSSILIRPSANCVGKANTIYESNVIAHKRKTAYKSTSSDINEILPFV